MTYIIEYTAYDSSNAIMLAHKKMRVKNANSEIHAKVKLTDYLAKIYPTFYRYTCHECYHENSINNINTLYSDIFNDFK